MKMSPIVGSLSVVCLILSVSGASVESTTDATAVDVQLLEGIIKRLNDTLYVWLSESEETTLPSVVNEIYSHVKASKLCDEGEGNSASSDSRETGNTHQDFFSEHIKDFLVQWIGKSEITRTDSRENKSHAAYKVSTPTTPEPTAIIPY
uniref:Putative secreted protein n=1 Tax=Anopheles aquasalis TaxID=42839 RepID=T1DQS8_ANOAQ